MSMVRLRNGMSWAPLTVANEGGIGTVSLTNGAVLSNYLDHQPGHRHQRRHDHARWHTLQFNAGTPVSTAVLNIGTGGDPGIVNATGIFGFFTTATNPPLVSANSTIIFNHDSAGYYFTNTGTSSGTGIVISGSTKIQTVAGTTILTAASTNFGANSVNGGTLILENTTGSGTGTGAITIGTLGTLQIGNGGTIGSTSGNITDNGALIFEHSDTLTYSGSVTGAGTLTQAGTGTLILTGTNGYTGGTTISTGTLQLGTGGATGSVVGNITDSGALIVDQLGAVRSATRVNLAPAASPRRLRGILTLSGTNSYQGDTSVTGEQSISFRHRQSRHRPDRSTAAACQWAPE